MSNTYDVNDHVIVCRYKSGYDKLADSAPELFGTMLDLAQGVVVRYGSDLFHDACWLKNWITDVGDARWAEFYWSVREYGTFIGLEPVNALVVQHQYRVILTLDDFKRCFATFIRIDKEPVARFAKCDQCDGGPAPYELSQPRPSDPSSLCCVLALCEECARQGDDHDLDAELLYEVQFRRVEAGYFKGVAFYE